MSYAPDPAGDFASDTHRRVLAAVPISDDELTLEERVGGDTELDLSAEEVEEVLRDLEADGHVKNLKDGWRHTKDGHELLTGPPQGARKE
jgi:hypothetical protein